MSRRIRRRAWATAAGLGLGLAALTPGVAAAQSVAPQMVNTDDGGLLGGGSGGGLLGGSGGGLLGGDGSGSGSGGGLLGGSGPGSQGGSSTASPGGNPIGTVVGTVNDALGKVTLSNDLLQKLSGAAGPNSTPTLSIDEARTKLFGSGWDNPNIVRGRAVGNTTWLMDYGGTIILHDSTIEDQLTDTGANKNTNGYVTLGDVIAAKPAAILQGVRPAGTTGQHQPRRAVAERDLRRRQPRGHERPRRADQGQDIGSRTRCERLAPRRPGAEVPREHRRSDRGTTRRLGIPPVCRAAPSGCRCFGASVPRSRDGVRRSHRSAYRPR
ncbi:hypothetical protein AAur_pTC10076 (plasmid) [Paenarthrobacter aurescens TC1]|uniref:Uncharacterized protein n=1 Tax=Paenarthrobacter aurescens (strain TC1) TaxID=290340 RepID=A1RCI8_PAEAT|nr:hypothetical protein AAur_pTC10076 [Paenarthrobacter aurescens TC1]